MKTLFVLIASVFFIQTIQANAELNSAEISSALDKVYSCPFNSKGRWVITFDKTAGTYRVEAKSGDDVAAEFTGAYSTARYYRPASKLKFYIGLHGRSIAFLKDGSICMVCTEDSDYPCTATEK